MKARVFGLALALSIGLSGAASAAQVYVVHGIPGQDVGAAAELPVDICLAGGTLVGGLTGVPFGAIAGPLELPAGRYDLEVRLADGACGGALAVANTVYLALGESASIVAHLSEEGVPALTRFTNDARSLAEGSTRLVVRHGAAVPPVNVTVKNSRSLSFVKELQNGEQSSAINSRAGSYRVAVYPKGSLRPVLSTSATLEAGTSYFAYAVGSAQNGTLGLVIQAIPIP
jgi:Domain of unknown function (DUF4397)